MSPLDFIIPPDDATPQRIHSWRWRVVIALGCGFLFTVFALSPMGFARAGDVDAKLGPIKEQLKQLNDKHDAEARESRLTRIEHLEGRLFENRSKQCEAKTSESRRFYSEKLQEMMLKYRNLTGTQYRLPGCEEL